MLSTFQTCDACFKHFEPILQKVMNNFNNVLTTLDSNSNLNVSEVSTITSDGKLYRINKYYNSYIAILMYNNRQQSFFIYFRSPKTRETRKYMILYPKFNTYYFFLRNMFAEYRQWVCLGTIQMFTKDKTNSLSPNQTSSYAGG